MAQNLLHLRYVAFRPAGVDSRVILIAPAVDSSLLSREDLHLPNFHSGLCKKRLDSTNSTEHSGELWCKICYSRKFGPKGVGFGCGAGTLNMDKVRESQHLGDDALEITSNKIEVCIFLPG